MNSNNVANFKINRAQSKVSKEDQVQSVIHPDLNFLRNSINILVSRRGVEKTYAVMREMIKLSVLPDCGGYNQLIYITEKISDSTVNELASEVKLKVKVTKYNDAVTVLRDIRKSKTAYEQTINRDL
jgi:hypothetical protein